MLKVGLVGGGHWGKNHARVLKGLSVASKCEFVGLADSDNSKKSLASQYGVDFFNDYKKLAEEVDAAVIAVPATELYKVSDYFLDKDKHILVEKPFALSQRDGNKMVKKAKKKGLTLMVGHIFLYTPQIKKIDDFIKDKRLGEIFYGYSQRLNLGIIRRDVNALWNFGPHDISIFTHIFNSKPIRVWARGKAYLQKKVEDVVFLGMEFPNGATVSSHLSWIDPIKTRKVTLVGDKAMLVWDDTSTEESIRLYDKGVVLPEETGLKASDSFGEFKMRIRYGDEKIPYIEAQEPLKNELVHFIESIEENKEVLSNGKHALEVLEVLLAAQESLEKGGKTIVLEKN